MFDLKAIFFTSLLFSICSAGVVTEKGLRLLPCEVSSSFRCGLVQRRIKSIKPGFMKVRVDHQASDFKFAVESTSSGFGRVTRVGVDVQRGVNAILHFNITIFAVSSRTLSSQGMHIRSILNDTERALYESLVDTYEGGLNVPSFSLVGIDLSSFSNRGTQLEAAETISNYNEKSNIVVEILKTVQEERLCVSGWIEVTSSCVKPMPAFAFIRLATIEFEDGSSITIVTTDPKEIAAAVADGSKEFTIVSRSINVIPFIGK